MRHAWDFKLSLKRIDNNEKDFGFNLVNCIKSMACLQDADNVKRTESFVFQRSAAHHNQNALESIYQVSSSQSTSLFTKKFSHDAVSVDVG